MKYEFLLKLIEPFLKIGSYFLTYWKGKKDAKNDIDDAFDLIDDDIDRLS